MVLLSDPSPRIIVMGLCDPSFPEGGVGPFLARSLRPSFRNVDVVAGTPEPPDFSRILRRYDVVVLLDTISMCGGPGEVHMVSPYALADLKAGWGEAARALDRAIHDAHVFGQRVPAIHVVAVCLPDVDEASPAARSGFSALYREVAPRVKQIVRTIIHEARAPAARTPVAV